MANTYTLISSNTLTSSAASVTFSSIPATYTDLVLKFSARTNQATSSSYCRITFNGASSGYSETYIQGDGSAASSGLFANRAYFGVNNTIYLPGSSNTANTFGYSELYLPSYLASQNKPVSIYSATENNNATAYEALTAGLFSDTTAISSITLLARDGTSSFISGSSFYLYGIKST